MFRIGISNIDLLIAGTARSLLSRSPQCLFAISSLKAGSFTVTNTFDAVLDRYGWLLPMRMSGHAPIVDQNIDRCLFGRLHDTHEDRVHTVVRHRFNRMNDLIRICGVENARNKSSEPLLGFTNRTTGYSIGRNREASSGFAQES